MPIHSNTPFPGIVKSLLINDYCHTFFHLEQIRNTIPKSMFYTCIVLVLSALPQIYAVPCQQIGKGNYDGPAGTVPQLDPFTAGQGFDIIQSQYCLLRFQNPDYNMRGSQSDFGQAIRACKSSVNYISSFTWTQAHKEVLARVTQPTWGTTKESYTDTCNNYNGGFGSNSMLWLGGAAQPCRTPLPSNCCRGLCFR